MAPAQPRWVPGLAERVGGKMVGGKTSRVKGEGRPGGLSNAVAIAVAIIIVLAGLASFAYMGRIGAEYAGNVLPEKLKEEGERGSELLRIYIWSRNHTLEGEPVITILNVWGKDSEIDVIMVANTTGHVVKILALGPPMKIPASTAVEFRPSDLGLAYKTFGELIENVGGILAHTVLGSSFGSTWGAPREDYVFGSIATTAITNVTTTVWVVSSYSSVQEETTITAYTTQSYPEDWSGTAMIIAYDHVPDPGCGMYRPCSEPDCTKSQSVFGVERPGALCWSGLCGPGVDYAPRFSWYLAMNPLKIERYYAESDPSWACSETLLLSRVTLSTITSPSPVIYTAVYTVTAAETIGIGGWLQLPRTYTYTFQTLVKPTGYLTTTTVTTGIPWWWAPSAPPRWTTVTVNPIVITTRKAVGVVVSTATTVTKTTTILHDIFPSTIVKGEAHTFTGSTVCTVPITSQTKTPYTVTVVVVRPTATSTTTVTQTTSGTYTGHLFTTTFTYTIGGYTQVTYRKAGGLATTFNTEGLAEQQAGNMPGSYGSVQHLYFKLAYPVYVIHRYYDKVYCDCKTYSPPNEGGTHRGVSNSTIGYVVCDIVVKQVENNGAVTKETIYKNCRWVPS
jgi:nucleotide-binding universal stress UspA family protein